MKISRVLTPFLLATCLTSIHGKKSSTPAPVATSSYTEAPQSQAKGSGASVTKKKGIVSWRGVGRESVKLVVRMGLPALFGVTTMKILKLYHKNDFNYELIKATLAYTILEVVSKYIYGAIGCGVDKLFAYFGSLGGTDKAQEAPKGMGAYFIQLLITSAKQAIRLLIWGIPFAIVTGILIASPVENKSFFHPESPFMLSLIFVGVLLTYHTASYLVDGIGFVVSYPFSSLKGEGKGVSARRQTEGALKLLLRVVLFAYGGIRLKEFAPPSEDLQPFEKVEYLAFSLVILTTLYIYSAGGALIDALFAPSRKKKATPATS